MSRLKNSNQEEENMWIPESRSFFTDVIADTFASLRGNSLFEISRNEQTQLAHLEKLWLKNYKPWMHQPESNPCPLPKLKRAPKKPRKRTTSRNKSKPEEQCSLDMNTLDDNMDIVYRICIPRFRSHWVTRSIDLKIKAYVCKNNLIEPLINWELLDSIMELPLEQATSLFQSRVDEMLQSTEV